MLAAIQDRINRGFRTGSLLIATLATGVAGAAQAETEVRFATGMPDTNPLMEQFFTGWVEEINAGSDGMLSVKTYGPPFANPGNVWERVTSGVADMGLVLLPYAGVPFPRSSVLTLPTVADDSVAASAAFYELYEKGLLGNEFDDVHLVGVTGAIAAQLITTDQVTSMEELAGLRVRVSDHNTAEAVQRLGASPISMPFSDVYQAITRGVIDAAVTNANTLVGYRLSEVTSYQVENISFGLVPVAIIMNKGFYEGLPEAEKAYVAGFSGMETSLKLGEGQRHLEAHFRQQLLDEGGFTYVSLPDNEVERWTEAVSPVIEEWVAETENGQAILDAFTASYATHSEGD